MKLSNTGELKPYPAIKDSGIEWLGDVPEHWAIRKLGQIGKLSKGSGGNKDDEVSKGIPCIRYGDLYTTHNFFIRKSRSFIPKDKAAEYTAIKFGDVLFAGSGETIDEIGKSAVNLMQNEAYCGGDVILFRPSQQIEPSYLGYAMDCRPAAAQKATMGRGITIMHIYGNQLKHLTFPLPPFPEQTAIVRFLDHADQRIRRYIRAKQKLIALLEEQKQAIIHQAVTRGIDAAISLKPTGNSWFPEVPDTWDVIPMGRMILRAADGPHLSPEYLDKGIPFLSARNIKIDHWSLEDVKFISQTDYDTFCQRVKPEMGDVLYTKGGTTGVARAVDLDFPFQVWVHVAVLKMRKDRVLPHYLATVLNTPRCYEQSQLFTRGATNQDLGLGRMKDIVLPLPPLAEQSKIIERVMAVQAQISRGTHVAFRQIELLREYRTRLIADVVTGKLDVREAAAALPEVDPLGAESTLGDTFDTDTELDSAELDATLEEANA